MPEASPRHPSAQRVDRTLSENGLSGRVRELPSSTRTAAEAAAAVGCDVGQIVKSLVFRTERSHRPVLVLASGAHRVDEAVMARFVGEPITRADPEYARTVTGFAIGGVPQAGHPAPLPTFVDYDLLEQPEVWAAAGHPHAVCRLTSSELLRLTRGRPVPVVPLDAPTVPARAWVTFDCLGTLVDWRRGFLDAIRPLVRGASPAATSALFESYLVEEQRLEAGPYLPYREIMVAALRSAAGAGGILLSRSDAERIPESIPQWPLFPDTRGAIDGLRSRGLCVGVLSNIDRDLLDQTLRAHGLGTTMSVTAEEVRAYKPSPAHWIRFLKATGADPQSVWHVAGEYAYDIPPASRLGFHTAFVARYREAPAASEADLEVRDLGELLRSPLGGVTGAAPGSS